MAAEAGSLLSVALAALGFAAGPVALLWTASVAMVLRGAALVLGRGLQSLSLA